MDPRFADQYAGLEPWHWWFRGRRQVLETILRRELPAPIGLRLASLGCGPAEGLGWLRPFAGLEGKVVGLDSDAVHARNLGDGFEFVVGTLDAVPLASGSFDAVLALDVLEHLDDDVNALREIRRIAKPGGLLMITVPAMPSLWGGQDVVSHHRRRYTRCSLLQTFTRAGLPPPRITYFNTLLFPPIALTRWLRVACGLRNRNQSDFAGRPGLLNDLLTAVFGAERFVIGRVPLWFGVSLLALCQQ